jgi:hypothetical protein
LGRHPGLRRLGADGWARALAELLEQARAAAEGGALDARVKAQKDLEEFRGASPNATAGKLDDLAREAMRDLFLRGAGESATSIASRSAELKLYVKDVQGAAAGARADAAAIRMTSVKDAIDAVTRTAQSVQDLRAAITGGAAPAAVLAQLEALAAQVRELRAALEKAASP